MRCWEVKEEEEEDNSEHIRQIKSEFSDEICGCVNCGESIPKSVSLQTHCDTCVRTSATKSVTQLEDREGKF